MTCKQCGEVTPVRLSRTGNPTQHHRDYCSDRCMKQYNNQNLKKGWRWYLYNLTEDDVYYMWLHQGGRCDICKVRIEIPTSVVDHNHTTEEVRALLCRNCNLGIGYFSDDTSILLEAVNYLNRS